MAAHEAQQYTKHSARKLMVSVAQSAGCPWEQAIELGRWAGTSLEKACVMSAEDTRRKHALEIMNMPKRYSANARLMRVARICGNQVQRMSSYLRSRPPSGPSRYETAWDLMPQYNPEQEGT